MNILLIGIQGCGKGTQAKILEENFGWKHITTGNLLRENIERQTELGLTAKKFMDDGELVPDKYVFRIVEDALANAKDGTILDGFPRNMEQLKYLEKNFTIDKVILLELSDEKAIERVSSRRNCVDCKKDYNLLYNKPKIDGICDVCGGKIVQRDDDHKSAILKRIEKFYNDTSDVISYFSNEGKLIHIKANAPIDIIQKNIVKALNV
ncbi:MAG: nucleoside monophosphate kinase [Candidatus Tenebribacter burtonii]|jgi:adenylate kinase|nr:nucleoside monophosphate kinase [Candidatus Tenebribacter burtonii]